MHGQRRPVCSSAGDCVWGLFLELRLGLRSKSKALVLSGLYEIEDGFFPKQLNMRLIKEMLRKYLHKILRYCKLKFTRGLLSLAKQEGGTDHNLFHLHNRFNFLSLLI